MINVKYRLKWNKSKEIIVVLLRFLRNTTTTAGHIHLFEETVNWYEATSVYGSLCLNLPCPDFLVSVHNEPRRPQFNNFGTEKVWFFVWGLRRLCVVVYYNLCWLVECWSFNNIFANIESNELSSYFIIKSNTFKRKPE